MNPVSFEPLHTNAPVRHMASSGMAHVIVLATKDDYGSAMVRDARGTRPARCARAMTLLEVLLVTTLIGAAFAMFATGFSGTSRAAEVRRVTADLAHADRLARTAARSGCGTVLEISTESPAILVRSPQEQHALGETLLPIGVTIALSDLETGESIASIWYDTRGVCADYRVTLEAPTEHRSWVVSGVSGWTTPDQPEERR